MKRMNASMRWMLSAACLGKDPELFFPPGRPGRWKQQADQARAICSACTVREPCLRLALQGREQFGIWGGYNALELARIQRRVKREQSGTAG